MPASFAADSLRRFSDYKDTSVSLQEKSFGNVKSAYDEKPFGENDKPHLEWARDAWNVSPSQSSKLRDQELELIDPLYH